MFTIRVMNTPNIDYHLLRCFDALLRDKSVSKAARRVGLSQPAMSHALARLREMLSDPLLVRSGREMMLTPRAEELAEPLRLALEGLERVTRTEPAFDPAQAKMRFVVQASDGAALSLLPAVVAEVQRLAPGVELAVRSLGENLCLEPLDKGEVDMSLAMGRIDRLPDRLFRTMLLTERFCCVVRSNHPEVRGERLDLDAYLRMRHLVVTPGGGWTGAVDEVLSRQGLERQIAMSVPHFLVAPAVVAKSDMVLTTVERIALKYAGVYGLKVVAPPIEMPEFSTALVWHERTHQGAAYRWLRGLFASVAKQVR